MGMSQTVVMKDEKTPSMARAIRKKCMDCSGGLMNEVRDCWAKDCPLFPYRFGKNPKTAIKALRKSYTVKVLQAEKEG